MSLKWNREKRVPLAVLSIISIFVIANIQASYADLTKVDGSAVGNLVGNASASASANDQSSDGKKSDNADAAFALHTSHKLYKPGDNIKVSGDASSTLMASMQPTGVLFVVTDNLRNLATWSAPVNTDGSYLTSF